MSTIVKRIAIPQHVHVKEIMGSDDIERTNRNLREIIEYMLVNTQRKNLSELRAWGRGSERNRISYQIRMDSTLSESIAERAEELDITQTELTAILVGIFFSTKARKKSKIDYTNGYIKEDYIRTYMDFLFYRRGKRLKEDRKTAEEAYIRLLEEVKQNE